MEVFNAVGEKSDVIIKAKLPKNIHRLKTALGLGPYLFEANDRLSYQNEKVAPAWMLYGNYELLNTTSIRFFNATVKNEALFNNGGVYFAYELANVFDGRFQLVPLLGFQLLSFDYNKSTATRHKIIYPQGFEAVYKHAFGLANWHLVYGMFISSSDEEPYKNLWLRFGKKWFGEVNYIEWQAGVYKVKTYGLSVGIPFLSFF